MRHYHLAYTRAVLASSLPQGPKLLSLALSSYAGEAGVCFAAVATLARDCSASPRAVQGWLRDLEARGVLRREEVKGRPSHLILTPPSEWGGEAGSPPQILHPRTTFTPADSAGGGELTAGGGAVGSPETEQETEQETGGAASRTHARGRTRARGSDRSALSLLAPASGGLAPPPSFSLSGSGSSAPWLRGVVQLLPQELQRERGVEEILGAYSEGTARAGALRTARAAAKGGLRSPLAYLRSCLERIKADGGGERPPEPPAPQRQDGGIGQAQKGEVEVESLESLHARFERGEDIGEEGELRLWPELRGQGARLAEMISWGAVFPPPLHQRREDHV